MDPAAPRAVQRADGLALSALGLGTAPLGGMFAPVDEADAEATLAAAFDLGMRYVDTAPQYGWGLAERRAGRALGRRPRDSFVLSTKVGRLLEPVAERQSGDIFTGAPPAIARFDFSRDGVLRSLEASLGRLGLDRVDVIYVHDPDDFHDQARDEAIPALVEMRGQGVVRAVGVGMNHSGPLASFVRECDIDIVLCAGRYSLLDQAAHADLLPLCAERGVAVVIGGVFNSGILADPRPGAPFDYKPAPEAMVARASLLGEICASYGVPLAAAALQLPFAHPAVCAVLVGARNATEVSSNAAALSTTVPEGLWQELKRRRLLPQAIPTP